MQKTLLILLSAIMLASVSPSWARPPHEGPSVERLMNTLNLDQRQAEQVSQILQEQRDKRETLRDTLHTQMRADMQALHQETVERLRPVLTDEQLQKFIQLGKARRARHEGRALRHTKPESGQ